MAVPSIIGERHDRLAGAGDNGPAVTPDMLELCDWQLLTLKRGKALAVIAHATNPNRRASPSNSSADFETGGRGHLQ